MSKIHSIKQLSAAVLAAGSLALALGAHADEASKSPACESARLSVWFERQRQLTDGDTNPFQQAATPRECAMTYGATASNDAAPAKQMVAAANVTQPSFPSGYEGVSLGGR